jgi:imidazolonepropionase-like amidohydrolase
MSTFPNRLEDWEFVPRHIDVDSRKTSKRQGFEDELHEDPPQDEEDVTGVFASLLIPGQEAPRKDQAVLLDRTSGKIVFVGDRSSIPAKYGHVKLKEVPVVMPGMWECHSHFMGASPNRPIDSENLGMTNPAEAGARSVRALKETLYAGFTSSVDLGGYACELQKVIDEGLILGPTLYGAGAAISMTAGHGEVFEYVPAVDETAAAYG